MLTSSANQYLRPEYLTPLPTTLDAKKSPLALLAQTCSQIGADSPSTKSLLPPLDKPAKSGKPGAGAGAGDARDKASPASSVGSNSFCDVVVKSSFKPYESSTPRDKSGSPDDRGGSSAPLGRVRTPSKSTGTPPAPAAAPPAARCHSNASAASPRSSPAAGGRKTPAAAHTPDAPAASKASGESRAAHSPVSAAAKSASYSSASEGGLKEVAGLAGAGYKSSALPGGYPLGYPGLGSHFPLDLMASHPHLKGGLNPYVSYARMKTAAGVDTLVPVCRDPYCTGCQLSSQLLASSAGAGAATPASKASGAAGACPGGCAQCEHSAGGGKVGGFLSPGHHSSAAAAAYAHAQLAALAAASHLPYVCSWIAGDAAYCGKRFSTSEELLQHLRSHTSLATAGAGESTAALAMLSPHLPPAHPLLHRTYPTPPLSPLATARYHPYSKPALLPPSSLGFPLHPHPGLPPYFSPYSLYGQRLGASGMHP